MFKNTVIVGAGTRETVADIPALMEGSLHALVVDNKSGSSSTIVFHLPEGDLDLPVETGKSTPTYKLNLPEGFLLEATVPAQITLSASYIEQAVDDTLAASIAIQAAQDALDAQQAAEAAAQDAVDDVLALLPEGTINDAITSLTSTWSSTKIAQELEEAGDVEEAPEDGKLYGRKDADWAEIPGGVLSSIYTEFTGSGSFEKDPESSYVAVHCVGGGAGARRAGSNYSAASGAQGWFMIFRAEDLPASVDVVVGLGGTNANGGDSSFNGVVALGGKASQTAALGTRYTCYNGIIFDTYFQNHTWVRLAKGTLEGFGWNATSGSGGAGGTSVYGGGGGCQSTSDPDSGKSLFAGNGAAGDNNGGFPGGGGGTPATDLLETTGGNGVVRIWQW